MIRFEQAACDDQRLKVPLPSPDVREVPPAGRKDRGMIHEPSMDLLKAKFRQETVVNRAGDEASHFARVSKAHMLILASLRLSE